MEVGKNLAGSGEGEWWMADGSSQCQKGEVKRR